MSNPVHPPQTTPSTKLLPAAQVETLFGQIPLKRDYKNSLVCDVALQQFGGAYAVLETIAHGRLLNEIALHLDLPVIELNNWVERNIDGPDISRAYQLGAETWMAKAHLCLSIDAADATEAAQARALAAEFRNMAEKLDPQRWGTKKSDGLAGQVVNIAMNLGGGTTVTATTAPQEAEVIEAAPFAGVEDVELMNPVVHVSIRCEEPTDGW